MSFEKTTTLKIKIQNFTHNMPLGVPRKIYRQKTGKKYSSISEMVAAGILHEFFFCSFYVFLCTLSRMRIYSFANQK